MAGSGEMRAGFGSGGRRAGLNDFPGNPDALAALPLHFSLAVGGNKSPITWAYRR